MHELDGRDYKRKGGLSFIFIVVPLKNISKVRVFEHKSKIKCKGNSYSRNFTSRNISKYQTAIGNRC